MLFNSTSYLLFLPAVLLFYWFIVNRSLRLQNSFLLICSYFFYGCWDWRFLFLLLASTCIDYYFGLVLDRAEKNRKLYLWICVINNLSVLFFFKYFNFFSTSASEFLNMLGFKSDPFVLDILLPVGISFYTFHGMSYVFDIYNRKLHATKDFVQYALFVSFFPLLVAGPIERANHLLPQIKVRRIFNSDIFVSGIKLILVGFFKKMVIADSIAPTVNYIFGNYEDLSGVTLIFGGILFSIQIYGDFCGYTDIALGSARLMGFELLTNFKFPYFSRDIAEFWRRWHISLSSWFRDYLYIPLGGSKEGKLKAIRNTFIIFLVSGFWHGANWTFIFWGFLHACFFIPLLLANRNRRNVDNDAFNGGLITVSTNVGKIMITFFLVMVAFIFFRATSVQQAFSFVSGFGKAGGLAPQTWFTNDLVMIGLMFFLDYFFYTRKKMPALAEWIVYLLLLIFVIAAFSENMFQSSFIYFQF